MIITILKNLRYLVKGNSWGSFGIFCIFGILVYHPAIAGGFFSDDFSQIVRNPFIRDLRNIPDFFLSGTFYLEGSPSLQGMYYRPLMMVGYALIYRVFGLNPVFFHSVQLGLHIINAYLIYFLFRTFFEKRYIAFLGGLLFLVHPLNVEVVAYSANLQDILMVFFGLLFIVLLQKMEHNLRNSALLFLLFLLTLFSKESGVVFLVFWYGFLFFFRHSYPRRLFIFSCFFIAGTLFLYVFMRCALAKICFIDSNAPIAQLSFIQRLLHIPAILLYYLRMMIFPDALVVLQQWTLSTFDFYSFFIPAVLVSGAFFVLFLPPVILYALREKQRKSEYARWSAGQYSLAKIYAFFLVWFLVGIMLYLQIIPLDFTVADRWFSVPLIGFLGMAASVVSLIPARFERVIYAAGVVVVVLLSIRSYVRATNWADHTILYTRDLAVSPSGPLHNNYGVLLLSQGKREQALYQFREALKYQPESPIYWSNLGSIMDEEGQYDEALESYKRSIEYGRWPDAFERYYYLLKKTGRASEARSFLLNTALPTFPEHETFKKISQSYFEE